MKRREFITLIGGAAAMVPLAARAQQPAVPVIGYLGSGSPNINYEQPFHKGLSETGYVVGRNVSIEHRWAEGRYDRLPALAAELVRLRVAVILASTSIAARAAKDATGTIPIVFVGASDPVQLGLVALNRPDSNLTGFTSSSGALEAKRVELLHELVPTASIGVLVNATNPIAESNIAEMQATVRAQGREVLVQRLGSERDFDAAFAALLQRQVGALLVATDPFFSVHRDQLVTLAARHSLPAMYVSREFAAAGGLISYSADTKDEYHQAGVYAGRILKGAAVAELPVQQPTIFELVINLKTAKALGITIPPDVLARADEVIE